VGSAGVLLGVPRTSLAVRWGATSCRNAAPLSLSHASKARVGDAGESAVFSSKPFFCAGTVETAVDRSLRDHEAEGEHAVSTDAVMREVQQEQQFLRLLHRMREELSVSDRVHDRVPYFQVRGVLESVGMTTTTHPYGTGRPTG
jgi:hypothetical protein